MSIKWKIFTKCLCLLTTAAILSSFGCSGDKKAWQAARNENTEEAYKNFIDLHPKSSLAYAALQKIAEIHFTQAKSRATILAYEQFLDKHPNSDQAASAQQRISFFLESRQPEFRPIRTARIIFEQSFEGFEHITTPYSQRQFTQNVESLAKELMNFAGIEVPEMDIRKSEALLSIRLNGRALGEKYSDGVYRYSGASLSGVISLKALDSAEKKISFSGKVDPPPSLMLMKSAEEAYAQPSAAPFNKALLQSTFGRSIIDLMYDSFGIAFLTAALCSKSGNREIINKWASLGAAAIDPLTEALVLGEKSCVRAGSAKTLGHIGDDRALQPLINALDDEDPSVRLSAVRALRNFKDPRIVIPLIELLDDENPIFQASVIRTLENFNDPRGVMLLIDLLDDDDSNVRISTVKALEHFNDSRAVIPLIELLDDEVPDVRESAIKTLGQIKDPRAVIPLTKIVESMQLESITAVKALGNIGNPEVIPCLISTLNDITQGNSVEAPNRSRRQELTNRLDFYVREVIEDFGSQSIEHLILALRGKNEIFQEEAFRILRDITKVDVKNSVGDWQKWWKENKDNFEKKEKK